MRIRLSLPIIRTVTTLTVRSGGKESTRDVSPSESSSQRLWTFLVPGFTPQVANESEGNRGLSQSERACGDAKGTLEWNMVGILRKRRGFEGKGRNFGRKVWLALGEEKRKRREIAVRNMSGRVAVGLFR